MRQHALDVVLQLADDAGAVADRMLGRNERAERQLVGLALLVQQFVEERDVAQLGREFREGVKPERVGAAHVHRQDRQLVLARELAAVGIHSGSVSTPSRMRARRPAGKIASGRPASNASSVIFSVTRVRSRVRLASTHSTGISTSLKRVHTRSASELA